MARRKKKSRTGTKSRAGMTWHRLKLDQVLSERHVIMAIDLGYDAATIQSDYDRSGPEKNRLMLEWIEDLYFEKHGHYTPVDPTATPEHQQEHPAENSLLRDPGEIMDDYLRDALFVPGSDDEPDEWYGIVGEMIEENERLTPASYGEIHEVDQAMLRRQSDFRKAASSLAETLGAMDEVVSIQLFGSVALPLWKEVPRFHRFRDRRIKVYHECENIDLAIRVTRAGRAAEMRKACSRIVSDLADREIYLSIAHHLFSLHLIDDSTGRYLGMVCHFNKCPKHKEPCRVPGCGVTPFVRVLPWFRFKPDRLNQHNSLVLFER